jgi:hypothetical protein
MKFLRGGTIEVNQESVSSIMLMEAGMLNPDYIPTIMRAYRSSSPLNYILDLKRMKTDNLNHATNNGNFLTVGSNHVRYRLDEDDLEIRRFKAAADGTTFTALDSNAPGKGGISFIAFTETNYDGFQEVIELGDNETYLINLIDPEEVSSGVYKHEYKLVGNNKADYVNPQLLRDGAEYKTRYNIHEQDFSERGVEKYSFKGWADAWLTLQRFKYSWSGTAMAMMKGGKVKGRFVANQKDEKAFITEAEDLMMQRATEQLNFSYIFGKSTVTTEGKVQLTNAKGRELMAGDGIFYSNGGPLRIPYNGWTKMFLEYLLQEIDEYVRPDQDGVLEVVAMMAPRAYTSFQNLMGNMGKTQNNNIEGTGSEKGINDTYAYYEVGGIRIVPMKEPSMRNRPRMIDEYGSYNNDMDVILLPLGLTNGGKNGVQLVQLRPMSRGTVAGIDEGGNIASSIDGSSTHVLFQNGIINQNKVIFLRQYTMMKKS